MTAPITRLLDAIARQDNEDINRGIAKLLDINLSEYEEARQDILDYWQNENTSPADATGNI